TPESTPAQELSWAEHLAQERAQSAIVDEPQDFDEFSAAYPGPGAQPMTAACSSLVAEGHAYAKAFIKHSIDASRALRLMADDNQRQALESYIDSLLPPPVPGTKPDKVAAQVQRCREASRGRRQCLAIRRVTEKYI